MLTRSEYLRIVREITEEWQLEWAGKVEPDPKYAIDGPSQYPEGIELLSAPSHAQADLQLRIKDAVIAAGDWPYAWWNLRSDEQGDGRPGGT